MISLVRYRWLLKQPGVLAPIAASVIGRLPIEFAGGTGMAPALIM